MKTLKTIFLSVFAMVIVNHFSIAQDYKHHFNVKSSGEVVSQQGEKLGWIEADGTLKNAKGEVVGKVNNNQMHDKVGKKMGAVSEDGTLTGTNGKVLYTVSTVGENGICKILDASGKEVGTVHENYKQQGVCAYHCLHKK